MAKVKGYNQNKFGDIVRKAVDTAVERMITRLTDIILKEIKSQFSNELEQGERLLITKVSHNNYELTINGNIDC